MTSATWESESSGCTRIDQGAMTSSELVRFLAQEEAAHVDDPDQPVLFVDDVELVEELDVVGDLAQPREDVGDGHRPA